MSSIAETVTAWGKSAGDWLSGLPTLPQFPFMAAKAYGTMLTAQTNPAPVPLAKKITEAAAQSFTAGPVETTAANAATSVYSIGKQAEAWLGSGSEDDTTSKTTAPAGLPLWLKFTIGAALVLATVTAVKELV